MKRTLLPAALALVLAGSVAFAQQPQTAPAPDAQQPAAAPAHHHHHAPNPERETRMLTKRLGLSADQQAKVEPILADRDQKIAALHADTTLSPQEFHQQAKTLHQATNTQLQAVLTPDQMQKMMAMRHGHRHHGDSPDQQPAPQPAAAPNA